jgi:hypothetical protein
MVTAINVSISGGNQSASGTMPGRERRDDEDEGPQPADRDHQAEQEQQVVRTFKDMPEPGRDKPERGLTPTRIEMHQAGVAVEFECAGRATGGQKAQRRGDITAKPVDARTDGKLRVVRLDRIFEQHIEQLLVPVEVHGVGEPRSLHVRKRLCIRDERPIRRQRHAHMHNARRWKRYVVFIQGDIVGQIDLDRTAQGLIRARQIEVTRTTRWVLDLDHRG